MIFRSRTAIPPQLHAFLCYFWPPLGCARVQHDRVAETSEPNRQWRVGRPFLCFLLQNPRSINAPFSFSMFFLDSENFQFIASGPGALSPIVTGAFKVKPKKSAKKKQPFVPSPTEYPV
jgi:hypothetical protein